MQEWHLSQSLDIDKRYVRYDIQGEGPPVVLVHGTPWSSFNLRHLVNRLSSSHTVYFYDLLGYGQSSQAEGDVSLAMQNRVLHRLLDHWQLENPIIVGHDFGGATALRTHLLNGMSFEKIILIDPVAVSPWGSPFFRHIQTHEPAFAGLPEYIHEAIVKAYVQTAAFKTIMEETLEGIVSPWLGSEGQADSNYTDEVQSLYSTITTPVLILWGRKDSWIPLERGEELQRMIPNALLRIIDDAGHLVIEEKPEELFEEILHFLRTP